MTSAGWKAATAWAPSNPLHRAPAGRLTGSGGWGAAPTAGSPRRGPWPVGSGGATGGPRRSVEGAGLAGPDGCFGSCPLHRVSGAACLGAMAVWSPTGGVCGGAQPPSGEGCRRVAASCGPGPRNGRASSPPGWRTRTTPSCIRASDGPPCPIRRPCMVGSSPLACNGRALCPVGGGPGGRMRCRPSGNRVNGLPFDWPETVIASRFSWTPPSRGMQDESGDGPSGTGGSGRQARLTHWLFGSAHPASKTAVAGWSGSR